MHFFLVSLLATLAGVGNCIALPTTHALHEARDGHSQRWANIGRAPANSVLPMRIGLAQSNIHKAHEYLNDVSHPSSPNYGKHWTSQQVIEAFAPAKSTIKTVRQWLENAGIEATLSENKAWFAFDVTADKAESLLHTTYYEYEDLHTGGVMPACERYHVPKYIQKHIDYITPGIKLLAPSEQPPASSGLSKRQPSARTKEHHTRHRVTVALPANAATNLTTCDKAITPACIAALYQIPNGTLAHPDNAMGIFEAELQTWDQADLNGFFTNFTSYIANGTGPQSISVDGGVAVTTIAAISGAEAMLDLELAFPIVYPQNITIWNVDDTNYQLWANNTYTWGFNTLLDAIDGSYCNYTAFNETGNAPGIDPTYPDETPRTGYNLTLQCGVYKPSSVMSISYGGQEADVPIAYQKRQCNEYAKLGLQGVSFIFASGDAGVGNYPNHGDGSTGCLGTKGDIFNPTWPNTCPYVTNVGATKVYPGRTVDEPESAAFDPAGGSYSHNYSSGGGFSNVYPIPDYQKSALSTFFADHTPSYPSYSALADDALNPVHPNVTLLAGTTGGVYNRIGRGVPDVAANGDNIAVYHAGHFQLSGGTSASAPIFGAIINRINEERLAANKTTLGFLNPTLYEHPEILNDIVNGSNPGCNTLGFSASKGWDPVTGLGTPNYPKMLALFMSLP